MSPQADLRKTLRKEIRAQLWPVLKDAGFDDFSELTAWRHAERWIDGVGIITILSLNPAYYTLCPDPQVTPATFQLHVGTYYKDIHLVPDTGAIPDRPRFARGQGPKYPTFHRNLYLARPHDNHKIQETSWPVKADGTDIEEVMGRAKEALLSRGLPWIEETHNISGYLAGDYARSKRQPQPHIEFSVEEQAEYRAWLEEQGWQESPVVPIPFFALPEKVATAFERHRRALPPRDHDGSTGEPYGDLRYGLLLGEGRWREALKEMREEADVSRIDQVIEQKYKEVSNMQGGKRMITEERKVQMYWAQKRAQQLSQLEKRYSE